jgi:cellobiose phosphorylase
MLFSDSFSLAANSSITFTHNETGLNFVTSVFINNNVVSDSVFQVSTESGAFSFNAKSIEAKGVELVDLTITNNNGKAISIDIILDGVGDNDGLSLGA